MSTPRADRPPAAAGCAVKDRTLRFIQQARQLGFSVREVSALVALWRNERRAAADVRRLATAHLRDIVAELKRMQQTLRGLIERCHGDLRPECPILNELAEEEY